MRIALFDYSLFYESLGLANLMGVLKANHYDFKLFIISEEKDLIQKIKWYQPDLLCFSTITGTHHISFQLSKFIRKQMDILTIFGGPHATLFPEESIREECVDIICRGEGEEPLIELLHALYKKNDYTKIKNLWVKKNGRIIRNEIRPLLQDLNSLPLPDRSEYLKYKVLRDLPLKRFITGYGCPYQCTFCHNNAFLKEVYTGKGHYLRKKSVDRVLQEIIAVGTLSKVERIHFHDDNFNAKKEWLEDFCDRYPSEIGVPWSCTVRVDMLNEQVVKMMRDAGCVGVTYGLETHNETVRNKVLKKNLTNGDFEGASRLFGKYQIKQIASTMSNLPGESVEDAFKTLHYARDLNVAVIRSAVYTIIQKQPIVKWLIENKYIQKTPEIDNFNPVPLEQSTLTTQDTQRLIRLSPFYNLMLKFPFLEPVFKFISYFPIGSLGRSRLFDGYLEMKFMNIPIYQGARYFLKIKKGLKAYQNLR